MKKIKIMQKAVAMILSVIMVFFCLPLVSAGEGMPSDSDNLSGASVFADELIQTEITLTPEMTEGLSLEPESTAEYIEDLVSGEIEGGEKENTDDQISQRALSSTPLTVQSRILPPSSDTYIYYSNANTSYGSSTELWVSSNRTTYLKYDLSSLPEGAIITNAYILVPYYYRVSSGYLYVGAYEVEEPWNESTLTWNNANSLTDISPDLIGEEQRATATAGQSASNHRSMTFDITELANKWVYSGENNGLALKYSDKRDPDDDDHNSSVILLSRENASGVGASLFIDYVVLEDGVYSFENVGLNGFYMDIQRNLTSPGAYVQQYEFTTAPETSFSRSGLYKVTRDSETGTYIIRLMLNNKLSFGVSGTDVKTKEIKMLDSDVSQSDMFTLEFAGNGYRIKPYNSSLVVSTKGDENASGVTGGVNSYLTVLSQSEAGNNGLWIPTKYTGNDRYGITSISASGEFIAGEQVTVTAISWTTLPGVNRQNIYVHSDYTNVATSTMNTLTSRMTMNIHDEGEIKVVCDVCDENGSTTYGTYEKSWTSELPFEEGTYFFKNVEEEQYMSLDDGASDKAAFGIHLELENFNVEGYQKWDVIHSTDGYYRIQNSYSGYVVTVQSAYVNSGDYALIQHSYDRSDIQLWRFEETADDRWVIRPKSGESYDTDWCMAAGAAELDCINVEQREYIDNDSYKDEWILQSINCILSTPLIKQCTQSWCWVACAEMLARTKHPTAANSTDFTTIEQEQKDAVYHVFGDDTSTSSTYDWTNDPQGLKNQGGIYTDVAKAAAYLVGQVSGEETFSGYATPYGEAELLRFLLDGHAVARLYGWATVSYTKPSTLQEIVDVLGDLNPTIGGHVTVIVGAEWFDSMQCYIYTVYDPWDGGSEERYTYSELLYNTKVDISGTMYETSLWFPTVVTKTDYSNKTFLEEIFGNDYSSN